MKGSNYENCERYLKDYIGRPIILFFRNGNSTSMYEIDTADDLDIDILEREVQYKHVSIFRNTYHIELTV